MRGVIYCRVSHPDQVNGTSLQTQKEACLRYAADKGIEVADSFIEKGESATAASRTEFLRAIDYCRKHKKQVDAFIVWKVDRFARNTTDHYGIQAELAKYGTRLHSVTEPIINDGPIGRMAEGMLASYAQFEIDIRKERCEGGMRRRISEGIWPWHPPIGYIHAKKLTDRRKTTPDEPDPHRFEIIKKGLREFASGLHTMVSLKTALNRWGLKSTTGRPIRLQFVHRMLSEKFYAGVLYDPWTGEEHQGKHTPMITLDEFYRIQGIKKAWSNGATRKRRMAHPDFPLRQLAVCICGRPLTGSWHKARAGRYAYYNCYNRSCSYRDVHISTTRLEQQFVELLNRGAMSDRTLCKVKRALKLKLSERRSTALRRAESEHSDTRTLEAKRTRLLEMRLNGEISSKEFLAERSRIESELSAVTARCREVDDTIEQIDVDAILEEAEQVLREPATMWLALKDVDYKRQFHNLVLTRPTPYHPGQESFGTAYLSHIYRLSEASPTSYERLVAAVGQNLKPILENLKQIREFLRSLKAYRPVELHAPQEDI